MGYRKEFRDVYMTGSLKVTGESTFEKVAYLKGVGDGGLTNYDLCVGNTTAPDYGMINFGDAVIGRTSYKVGNIDLDGAVIIRNISGPVTGEIEFIFTESGGGATRFALPKSGVGNATYNPRSMLIAGPAPNNTDMVTVGYWQTNKNIFHNLACDTSNFGADLGVQNDLEVEGDIFTDSIKESTTDAGIKLVGKLGFFDTNPVVQPNHIIDANGTLADLTTKFNSLLTQLAALGLQAAA